MSQFRCFGGRKTVIIDVRFVLVIPQLVIVFDFYYFLISRFLGCIWSGHFLSGSFEVRGNVGFKKSHSVVSASDTASGSTWSLVILSASISN